MTAGDIHSRSIVHRDDTPTPLTRARGSRGARVARLVRPAILVGLVATCIAIVLVELATPVDMTVAIVPWLVTAFAAGVAVDLAGRTRRAERHLADDRALDDVVLRFTDAARRAGTGIDAVLNDLEANLRLVLDVSHVTIATSKAVPHPGRSGSLEVPVEWHGRDVARISVGPVDASDRARVRRDLERVATFVGATIAHADADLRQGEADASHREANLVKDRFVAMASHELRTPLTSIRGFSETMSRQWEILADEDKQRFLAIVVAQSERLSHLVDDLLLLSGIQSGRFALCPVPVHVIDAFDHAVEDVGGATVRVACDPDVRVFADADHLAQILGHFLRNAAQYGAAPITLSCHDHGGMVTLEVSDRGPGIRAEFEARLFGEFQRDRGALGVQGTGLGLSIVRSLARAYGGDAWHEPNAPTGARFLVRLPTPPPT